MSYSSEARGRNVFPLAAIVAVCLAPASGPLSAQPAYDPYVITAPITLNYDGTPNGPMGAGSLINFTSGNAAIQENWGLNLFGGGSGRPVKIYNSALLIGYTTGSGANFPPGDLFVQNNLSVGTTGSPSGFSVSSFNGGADSNWFNPANYAGWIHNNNNTPSHYGLLVSDYWRTGENFVFAVDGRFYGNGTIGGDVHNPYLVVRGNGNVGIGTANPQSLLAVGGTVTAQEVVVTGAGWSDYVFGTGYRLTPLNEVADYIRTNHHLPEIPSGKEVGEKGIGVGEMQSKLLTKIEELTLHMIAADRDNKDLRKKNRQLADRIARLEAGAEKK